MNDNQIFAEAMHLLSGGEPVPRIQPIDYIRALPPVADSEAAGCNYDPQGHTENVCRVFRAKADELEQDMERRIGWY